MLLDLRRELEQIEELSDPGTAYSVAPGEFASVVNQSFIEQFLELDSETYRMVHDLILTL